MYRDQGRENVDFCIEKKNEGVITVYFAFLLPVLLALLAVSVQSASVHLSEVQMKRILRQAILSELAGYDRELYDQFHIFGKITGEALSDSSTEELAEQTYSWVQLNTQENEGFLLTNSIASELDVTEYKTLTMNRGEEFRRQAVDYMKYKNVESLLEWLFSKLDLFESMEQSEPLLKKQLEVTEEFAKIDEKLQELIQVVDGILIKDGKIKKSWTGKIQTADRFTKQLISGSPNGMKLKINNEIVFQALQNKYIDPDDLTKQMNNSVELVSVLTDEEKQCETAIEEVREGLECSYIERDKLKKLQNQDMEQPEDEIKLGLYSVQLKELEKEITVQEADMKRLEKKLKKIHSSITLEKKKYKNALTQLNRLELNCQKSNQEALELLQKIRENQREAGNSLDILKQLLETASGVTHSELLESISENIVWMNEYLEGSGGKVAADIDKLEEQIKEQEMILNKLAKLTFPTVQAATEQPKEFYEILEKKDLYYKQYAKIIPGFDYSWAVQEGKGEGGIIDTIKILVNNGITETVVKDYDSLSKQEIKGKHLPSKTYGISEDIGLFRKILQLFQNISISELFSSSESGLMRETLDTAIKGVTEKVLMLTYFEEHFGHYQSEKINRVLNYELEYILSGSETDKENVSSVISKIMYWRFLPNLIYLLTNRSCIAKAETAAVAAVGFTGLTALINLTKYLILAIWGAAAALVETSAIVKGKQVAFFVNENKIAVDIGDLLSLSKEAIQTKGEQLPEVSYGLSYKDYLRLFLLLQPLDSACLRTMDLIQETLRLYYNSDFYLDNCICGYRSELTCTLPLYFLSLPFVNTSTYKATGKKYNFTVSSQAAY